MSRPTCGRPSRTAVPGARGRPRHRRERWACTGGYGGGWRRAWRSSRAWPPPRTKRRRRALALAKLSVLSFWLGDFARTRSAAASAMEMGAATGDTRSQALALRRLGALVILGDSAAGDPMLMRVAELARAAGTRSPCAMRSARWRSATSARMIPARCAARSRKRSGWRRPSATRTISAGACGAWRTPPVGRGAGRRSRARRAGAGDDARTGPAELVRRG